MDSETEPQQYRFYSHELRGLNTNVKTFSFSAQIIAAKLVHSTKATIIAKELFSMLQSSKKGAELMEAYNFEFKLDSKFILQVSRPPQVS